MCLLLTLSFLFVQWSILVGFVFFRIHKTIYLHWKKQRGKVYLALGIDSCKADPTPRAIGLTDFQGHWTEPFRRAAFWSAYLGFHACNN